MNQEIETQKKELLSKLQQGSVELQRISHEIISARVRLMPLLEKAWNNLKLAETYRNAL
jgi:hypothetical protein